MISESPEGDREKNVKTREEERGKRNRGQARNLYI